MYLQIIEQIRQRIAVGDWPAGSGSPQSASSPSTWTSASSRSSGPTSSSSARASSPRSTAKGSVVATAPTSVREFTRQELATHLEQVAADRAPARPDARRKSNHGCAKPLERLDRGSPRNEHDRCRTEAGRRREEVQVLRAQRRPARAAPRPHHGVHRAERRRQVDDDPHPDGPRASGSRRRHRPRPSDAGAAGGGEVGHRFRLRGHAALRRRHARLAHALHPLDLPGVGRGRTRSSC